MYIKVLLFLFCTFALMIIWQPAGSRANQKQNDQAEPRGLQFRLSEAGVESEPVTPIARPTPTMLGDSEMASLLDRLPPLKLDPGDQQQSSLRGQSLPPPRTGTVLTASFPPSESAEPPDKTPSGPLEVVRFSPQGQVPIAPELSVTFSQPMVAVTSQELAATTVPVKLTPQPAGHWRWLGTKTVVFEPDGRFPMATSYSVEVPAGTKSVTGGTLTAAHKWSFVTPPPQITRHYPEGENQTYSRNPLLFIEFDQRIDEAAALKSIRISAARQQWQIRPASADEIAADENVTHLVRTAVKDRYLVFRVLPKASGDAQQTLPGGTTISVVIGAGFKSAEGPRPTSEPQSFRFQTYGPLHFARVQCGYDSGGCRPGMPWQLFFSNPLDLSAFDKSQIKVEPELPGFDAHAYGNWIEITGVAKGRTLYRVTFDPVIRDQFGQTLGQAAPAEVNVGSMEPAIAGPAMGFVVLDPAAPHHFSIYSVNQKSVNLSIYTVGPQDWSAYLSYLKTTDEGHSATPPGRLMTTRAVPIDAPADQLTETTLDISDALNNGFGQLFVLVTPGTRTPSSRRQSITAWVQSTQIGLDAFVDDRNLIGWATSLKDGKPIDGVELSISSAGTNEIRATTRSDGIATMRLPASNAPAGSLLIARKGGDLAILPESVYWWGRDTGWRSGKRVDWLNWYVADDRGLYRPGEEVHVKGWIRRIGYGPQGDVSPSTGIAREVSYVLKDSVGNEVLKGRLPVNGFGGFDAALKLPSNMNLGHGNLEMNAEGDDPTGVERRKSYHPIRVEEFRRPEYEVNVTATEGLHFVGEHANVIASASYYAGGGLPNAEVEWNVVATTTNYTPPNRSDFIFGKWRPWWGGENSNEAPRQEHFSGHTDASGKHRLRIDFDSAKPALPTSVTANAAVTDVNRQAWSGSQTLLIHPANLYVGLRSKRTFVEMGQPLKIESIVTDLDGKAVAQREVRMRVVLLDWKYEKDRWQEIEVNPQDCVIRSGVDPVSCQFPTKQGGRYRIVAIVKDDKGRENQSEMILWVSGGKMLPQRDVAEEKIELIPDRKEYHDGDTAEVLVQAPFYPADGVLTLRRSGLLKTEHFTMDGPSHTLHIPISDAYVPNVYVEVLLNGASTRTDDAGEPNRAAPKRPAFAAGSLNLEIPPVKRELTVRATPKETSLEPGAETTVDVEVKDSAGRAVPDSEVGLIVVDEAILALTGYRIHDPGDTFYQDRSPDVRDYHLRSSVTLAKPQDLNGELRPVNGRVMAQTVMVSAAPAKAMDALSMSDGAFRAGSGGGVGIETAIRARTNFNPLAMFSPSVITDSAGRASVKIRLPDNLTRYRVTAIAVAGSKQFGMGESAITARLPLMVRLSAPRFLNFGDRFELPVVVQNQTDNPLDVSVAVRAGNAILTNGGGRKITVPANDRVEVRFPAKSSMPGTARFQVAGAAGKWADASEASLPVWTPATTEAFATYGEVDKGSIIQTVISPSNVIPQFGGLEVSTSSTQLQALTDAFVYLVDYPFECSEQLASRVLAVAALRDVLGAFDAKGLPKPDELSAAVTRDIRRLQGIQNEDGSFGFWRRGDRPWPYLGIHAANALIHAKQKGFEVPASMLERSKRYLAAIETRIPADYSAAARQSLIAYALNVQHQMGDRPLARARRLITETGLEKMPLEALGWLLPVLSSDSTETAAVLKLLNNRVQETASAASFTTSYSDGAQLLLHSDRRADGVILEGLIAADKSSDLIPKVVRGLLAHRVNGRWANTQENAFVLLALDRYFATYEKQTPDFVARAWLGDSYAGEHTFKGRSTDRYQIEVPMKEVVGRDKLVLSKEGEGRLYYRIGMSYAPSNLQLQPADYGFTVARVYEAVDKPSDVRREEDGTWHIKAGATVRVRVTLVAPARRYHVALVDPLPAGLEVLNPSLAVTPEIPRDPQNPGGPRPLWSWMRPWFDHQNMRDDRIEAFTSLLWEGVYNYSYVARATTPGVFIVAPSKAEEMYSPETFGRGSTDRVVIE